MSNLTISIRETLLRLPQYLAIGALAGVFIGLAEAAALNLTDPALNDRAVLWWAPLFYAVLFAPVGLVAGIAARACGAFVPGAIVRFDYAFAFGVAMFAGAITAGRWRVLFDASWLAKEYGRLADAGIAAAALTIGILAFALAYKAGARKLAALALLLFVASAAASFIPVKSARTLAPAEAAPGTGPHVILIAIDTLRVDYLKPYNANARAETPRIEAFIRDSILFEQGVAQSPWTKPSFGAIYTSQHPREHTAIDRARRLPDELTTLAEALRNAGYDTLGMSNSNPNNSSAMNFDQGFRYFEDMRPGGYNFGVPVSGQRLALYSKLIGPQIEKRWPYTINVEQYFLRADRITDTALRWIDSESATDRPFFMMLHYMDPHDPYMNGKRSGTGYSYYRFKNMNHGDQFIETIENAYAGDIEFMDAHLGALFDALKLRRLYDEALIVLVSDHGEEFREHGDFYHGRTLYEESIRIPFIVKLPKNAAAGAVNEHLAQHIDIAPTVLSLAGVSIPESMRGNPLLSPNGNALNTNIEHAFSETNLLGPNLASVRTESTKFIRDGSYGGEVTKRELYDLEADPDEQHNIVEEADARAATLAAVLDAFLAQERTVDVDESGELDPGVAEQLKALGYVE